jgi:hypothetical protein
MEDDRKESLVELFLGKAIGSIDIELHGEGEMRQVGMN